MVIAHPWDAWQLIEQAIWLALFFVSLRAGTIDLSELDRLLGRAVLDALDYAELPVKAAAVLMGMDESHLRKALRGEPSHHLSLTRLTRLPLKFWMHFSPTLIALMVRQHVEDVIEDCQIRKRA